MNGGSHYWDWTGKILGTYEAPHGIKLSSVYKTQNGEAHERTIQVNCDRVVPIGQTCAQAGGRAPNQQAFNLTAENSGMNGNFYPTMHLVDVSVGKLFKLERLGSVTGSFDLFNIFNINVIRGWTVTSSTTRNPDGSIDPTFRRPTSILPPRIFRLTFKWDF